MAWKRRKPRRRRGSIIRTGGVSERKQVYLAYMRSPAWRAYRAAWWEEYDRRNRTRACYCCGRLQTELKRTLELHHRTYERLGQEQYDDLVAVCGDRCHPWITRTYRARGRTGLTTDLWELTEERKRRMAVYNAKKHGPGSGRAPGRGSIS
jgi:hypothetical protein